MRVLALDTALGACQAAVVTSARPEAAVIRRIDGAVGRSEAIVGLADEALAAAGAGFGDIGRIAVTVGPGSFTGIRVALGYARGLGAALGVPVIGVGTLDAFAAEAAADSFGAAADPAAVRIVAVVDARHGAAYARCYDGAGSGRNEPSRMKLEEIAATMPPGAIVIGNAADLLAAALGHAPPSRSLQREAVDIVTLARFALAARPPLPRAAPLYLREADAIAPARAQVARR